MRIGIATVFLLVALSGCSGYRGGSPQEIPGVREDLAYFDKFLKPEIHGEWLGGPNRVFALHLQVTNSGSRSISACIGENARYRVASQSPHVSPWPDTKALNAHPVCASSRSTNYSFALAPGESFQWSEYLELPDSFQGKTKGQATIQLMKPDSCARYGCFSIMKVIETDEAVSVEPTPPNPGPQPDGTAHG
jgi:hypothetical protein